MTHPIATRDSLQSKHKLTPWVCVKSHGERPARIVSTGENDGGNFYVATCNRNADAAFIVQAVNSHEALVEALNEALVELEKRSPNTSYRESALYTIALLRVRAALNAAQGNGAKE